MLVLGIESSCDECAAAVVEEGRKILAHTVATQIEEHRVYSGVVPEIASRLHTQWIQGVVRETLREASLKPEQIDGVAVTSHPGLTGSLLVGLSFAKAFAWSLRKPFVGVDHILAHLYAPQLDAEIPYPFLGLLVSGGHSLIVRVDDFDQCRLLGTTIDDACGEAYDKVAKYFGWGYPGGAVIDRMAQEGDSSAFHFPKPRLKTFRNPYDVSYSGLKTAVINQREQFRSSRLAEPVDARREACNLAASFQKTAITILMDQLEKAVAETGLKRVVAGGGVAANSFLRQRLEQMGDCETWYPPLSLCTDNGAMIAGLGYHYLVRNRVSSLRLNASARASVFTAS